MEDWKIKVGLWECKNMYGLTEEEEMLPFLPRVNDVFWMSDACEERLRKRLRKCLKEHGCGTEVYHIREIIKQWNKFAKPNRQIHVDFDDKYVGVTYDKCLKILDKLGVKR